MLKINVRADDNHLYKSYDLTVACLHHFSSSTKVTFILHFYIFKYYHIVCAELGFFSPFGDVIFVLIKSTYCTEPVYLSCPK